MRYDWWVYFNFVLAKQKITKQTDINKIMFLVLINQFYTSNNFSFYLKGLLYLFSCSPPRLRAEVCRKDEIYYWKYILQTEAVNFQLNYCKMDRPVIILHLLKYKQIKSHESSFTKIHLNWDWTTTVNKK